MPYHYPYHRPPSLYAETLALRRRDAIRSAERAARASQRRIADAIEEHGERMSEEGRGLLAGLGEALKGIGRVLGGGRA